MVIDRGKEAADENKAIFDQLKLHRAEIEAAFGGPLDWYQQVGVRLCRIRKLIEIGGYRDSDEQWPLIHDAMIDAMIRLEKALRPFLLAIQ